MSLDSVLDKLNDVLDRRRNKIITHPSQADKQMSLALKALVGGEVRSINEQMSTLSQGDKDIIDANKRLAKSKRQKLHELERELMGWDETDAAFFDRTDTGTEDSDKLLRRMRALQETMSSNTISEQDFADDVAAVEAKIQDPAVNKHKDAVLRTGSKTKDEVNTKDKVNTKDGINTKDKASTRTGGKGTRTGSDISAPMKTKDSEISDAKDFSEESAADKPKPKPKPKKPQTALSAADKSIDQARKDLVTAKKKKVSELTKEIKEEEKLVHGGTGLAHKGGTQQGGDQQGEAQEGGALKSGDQKGEAQKGDAQDDEE